MKNILKALFMSVIISSSPLLGNGINKFQEVPQITAFDNNGEEGEYLQKGEASFYSNYYEGRKSASGKIFRQKNLVCAHMTLPFGTKLKVTNTKNGKSVIVTVIDRGKFPKGRIIDLSSSAFNKIGNKKSGLLNVKIEKL